MDKRLLIPAAVFLTLLVLGGIPRWRAHQMLVAGEAPLTIEVSVANPRRVATGNLTLPANLDPFEETSISARTTGVVARRFVDLGARVRKGQVLAELDAPDLDSQADQAVAEVARAAANEVQAQAGISDAQAQVARSGAKVRQSQANVAAAVAALRRSEGAVVTQQAQVANAKSRLKLTEITYQRWSALLKDGAVPPQEVDDRRSQWEQAQAQYQAAVSAAAETRAQLEAARAQLEAARADLNASSADENSAIQHVQAAVAARAASQAGHRSSQANAERYKALQSFEKVAAPFNGVITARNIDVGSLVGGGIPTNGMFHLARSDVLRTRVQIPEAYSSAIKLNSVASVVVPQFPERRFEGKVFRRSGALDGDTRTLQVEIKVENPSGVLIPGMYGQVQFELPSRAPLRVPASCVMVTAKGPLVQLVDENNQVNYVSLELGEDLGTEIEVIKGLQPEAKLLTNPSYSIANGTVVKTVLLPPLGSTPTPTPSGSTSPRPGG